MDIQSTVTSKYKKRSQIVLIFFSKLEENRKMSHDIHHVGFLSITPGAYTTPGEIDKNITWRYKDELHMTHNTLKCVRYVLTIIKKDSTLK